MDDITRRLIHTKLGVGMVSEEEEEEEPLDDRMTGDDDDANDHSSDTEKEENPNDSHFFIQRIALSNDVFQQILLWLDEDSIGHCICTCQSLARVISSNAYVFEQLCRRIYPIQSQKAAKFLGLRKYRSWQEMLQQRFRVRYAGFYTLKTSYIKKPVRDMWNTFPVGTIIESIYYRSFYFQRDGTVHYLLDIAPPERSAQVFERKGHQKAGQPQVCHGLYSVDRDEVHVSVATSHAIVEFRFRIEWNGRGRHVILVFEEHCSRSLSDPNDIPSYHKTYGEHFQFYRAPNLA